MTAAEARAMIASGYAWIRYRGNEDKEHWGGGRLLAVEGDHAIIRPGFRHRKNEKVLLSDIKPWKSKNAGRMQRDGVVLRKEQVMKYVVIDKELSLVWAGSQKGFLEDLSHATVYEGKTAANKGIGGMKRSNRWSELGNSERVQVVHYEEAEAVIETARPPLPYKAKSEVIEEKPKVIEAKPVVTDQAPTKKNSPLDEFNAAMQELDEARTLVLEAKSRVDRAIEGLSKHAMKKTEEALALSSA